jgi:hypothetical protein
LASAFWNEQMKICSSKLTTCSVSDDGELVALGLLDRSGKAVSVQLPYEQAESVVMTLTHLLARALKRRTGLESSRYVFRVSDWSIERAEDHDCLILTVATVDGFEVSLGISSATCGVLGARLHDESEKAIESARSTGRAQAWRPHSSRRNRLRSRSHAVGGDTAIGQKRRE